MLRGLLYIAGANISVFTINTNNKPQKNHLFYTVPVFDGYHFNKTQRFF